MKLILCDRCKNEVLPDTDFFFPGKGEKGISASGIEGLTLAEDGRTICIGDFCAACVCDILLFFGEE